MLFYVSFFIKGRLDKRDELTKKLQKEDAWQELLYQNKDKRIWMKFT